MLRPITLDSTDRGGSMAKRGALSTVGVVTQGAVRFLTSIFVGRIGGPLVLGSFASAVSTAQLSTLLWPSSAGSAASKFVARARGRKDSLEASAVAVHLAKRTLQATVLLSVVAAAVWIWILHGHIGGATTVATLVVGYSVYNFTRGLQFGAGKVARATSWDVISSALGLAGVLGLLIAGVRGLSLLLPLAAAYSLYGIAGWPWRSKGQPTRRLRREIDAFVALGVVGTVASAGFLQLSMIVARLSHGSASAGQYAAALTLATPPSLLAGSFSLVLFPSMAEAWGRSDLAAFREQTDRATRLLVLVMLSLFGTLILCSTLAVNLIWGAKFANASEIVPFLMLAAMINTLGVACTNALTTRSQKGMLMSALSSLTGMAVGVVAWGILTPTMGVTGVAIGYLIGTLVIAGVPIAIVWRRDGHHWTRLWLLALTAVLLVVSLLWVERKLALNVWVEPWFALIFLCGWLFVMRPDVAKALTLMNIGREK